MGYLWSVREKDIAILSSKPSEETKIGKFDRYQSSHVFFLLSLIPTFLRKVCSFVMCTLWW